MPRGRPSLTSLKALPKPAPVVVSVPCRRCEHEIHDATVAWYAHHSYHLACLTPDQVAWAIPKPSPKIARRAPLKADE